MHHVKTRAIIYTERIMACNKCKLWFVSLRSARAGSGDGHALILIKRKTNSNIFERLSYM
jgi:hypothetical protein